MSILKYVLPGLFFIFALYFIYDLIITYKKSPKETLIQEEKRREKSRQPRTPKQKKTIKLKASQKPRLFSANKPQGKEKIHESYTQRRNHKRR